MKNILQIPFETQSKKQILEKIKKDISTKHEFLQIISLNPEIFVLTEESGAFKKVVAASQIKIIDGVGTQLAARILGFEPGERLTGVELMEELFKLAGELSLRVMLIGGREGVAERVAICYSKIYPQARFLGIQGVKKIQAQTEAEKKTLFAIVADYKPHFVFVSFGSPFQELWIEENKSHFQGIICMGVGGAFDFLSGEIPRAPHILRQIGLEWLFRLLVQPWRWRRQLRLIKFVFLILKQKISGK